MHKLATTSITMDCFETDDYSPMFAVPDHDDPIISPIDIIKYCEWLRQKYLETKDKHYWKELVRWLPEGWLQTRTWTGSYENLRTMAHQRNNHKLTEWSSSFMNFIRSLPYANEFILFD